MFIPLSDIERLNPIPVQPHQERGPFRETWCYRSLDPVDHGSLSPSLFFRLTPPLRSSPRRSFEHLRRLKQDTHCLLVTYHLFSPCPLTQPVSTQYFLYWGHLCCFYWTPLSLSLIMVKVSRGVGRWGTSIRVCVCVFLSFTSISKVQQNKHTDTWGFKTVYVDLMYILSKKKKSGLSRKDFFRFHKEHRVLTSEEH